MEILDKEKFEEAENMEPTEKEEFTEMTEADFNKKLEIMQNPIKAQQEICAQISHFLDKQIKYEKGVGKGTLSDHTRRWVETYNKLLDNIQKSLFGSKSVNLHVHKVSHSDIAAKMREVIDIPKKEKKCSKKS